MQIKDGASQKNRSIVYNTEIWFRKFILSMTPFDCISVYSTYGAHATQSWAEKFGNTNIKSQPVHN